MTIFNLYFSHILQLKQIMTTDGSEQKQRDGSKKCYYGGDMIQITIWGLFYNRLQTNYNNAIIV